MKRSTPPSFVRRSWERAGADIVVALLIACGLEAQSSTAPAAGDKKLATIDGKPITEAQVLELMLSVRKRTGDASILLITHNLAVVAETCERVAVMYGGKIQEIATTRDLFRTPLHPYTQGLLASLPRPDKPPQRRLTTIPGIVPSILDFPKGCTFWTRCPFKQDVCERQEPALVEIAPGHSCRCHFVTPESPDVAKTTKRTAP